MMIYTDQYITLSGFQSLKVDLETSAHEGGRFLFVKKDALLNRTLEFCLLKTICLWAHFVNGKINGRRWTIGRWMEDRLNSMGVRFRGQSGFNDVSLGTVMLLMLSTTFPLPSSKMISWMLAMIRFLICFHFMLSLHALPPYTLSHATECPSIDFEWTSCR